MVLVSAEDDRFFSSAFAKTNKRKPAGADDHVGWRRHGDDFFPEFRCAGGWKHTFGCCQPRGEATLERWRLVA
jgi:hypothetical protein